MCYGATGESSLASEQHGCSTNVGKVARGSSLAVSGRIRMGVGGPRMEKGLDFDVSHAHQIILPFFWSSKISGIYPKRPIGDQAAYIAIDSNYALSYQNIPRLNLGHSACRAHIFSSKSICTMKCLWHLSAN